MPNWCANRLMFSGVKKDADNLKKWIEGDIQSLHRRAVQESIHLFVAGCAGIFRPSSDSVYAPFPRLTSHGVNQEDSPASRAFNDWFQLFISGAALEPAVCENIHRCWLESGIGQMTWNTLNETEEDVIHQLYEQKYFDWQENMLPQSVATWWDALCRGVEKVKSAHPMDFRDILPPRIDVEVAGFNGGLLTEIPSSHTYYINRYGCKWPEGRDMNICYAGKNTLTVDFDTPWSPLSDEVIARLSLLFDCEVEHWFAEQGCDFCGYGRYQNGEKDICISDALEWEDVSPEDEDFIPEITGPEWLINNIAHFGG